MFYLKRDYSTDLKTIKLDHSYSNVKLNIRSKYFPTSYIFRSVPFSDDQWSHEVDVVSVDNQHQAHNSKIADKYFDQTETSYKKKSLNNTAYVAKLCDKDQQQEDCWPIEVDDVAYKKYKELINLLHFLQLKLESRNHLNSIDTSAMDRNDIDQTYITFIKHLFFFQDKDFSFLKNGKINILPGLSWIHEALIRSEQLIAYMHLLQVMYRQCPSVCCHMIKDHRRKLNATASETFHLLLQSPWDIVPHPLQSLSDQVNFIFVPDYCSESINQSFLPSPSMFTQDDVLNYPHTKQTFNYPRKPSQFLHPRLKFLKKLLQSLGPVNVIKPPYHMRCCKDENNIENSSRSYSKLDDSAINSNNTGRKERSEMQFKSYIHYVVSAFERKVKEIRSSSKGAIVLLCQHNSSLLSSLMPLNEISASIFLGFPICQPESTNFIIKTPTLFVIGKEANNCPIESLEMITRSTNQTTGIVIVGGANESLSISLPFRLENKVTETMSDGLIANLIKDFISHVLELNS